MNGKGFLTIGIVLIILIGGWYLLKGTPAAAPSSTTATQTTTTTTTTTGVDAETIAYTDQGFSPKSITVKQGTTVSFVNQSGSNMWVASGVHPNHTVYDGTDRTAHCASGYAGPAPFDECTAVSAGATYTFTFNKVGTWPYHNHVDPSDTGSVTVTAQ